MVPPRNCLLRAVGSATKEMTRHVRVQTHQREDVKQCNFAFKDPHLLSIFNAEPSILSIVSQGASDLKDEIKCKKKGENKPADSIQFGQRFIYHMSIA